MTPTTTHLLYNFGKIVVGILILFIIYYVSEYEVVKLFPYINTSYDTLVVSSDDVFDKGEHISRRLFDENVPLYEDDIHNYYKAMLVILGNAEPTILDTIFEYASNNKYSQYDWHIHIFKSSIDLMNIEFKNKGRPSPFNSMIVDEYLKFARFLTKRSKLDKTQHTIYEPSVKIPLHINLSYNLNKKRFGPLIK